MGAVFDADDHLAAAVAEIKKLQAQVRLLTERSNGLLNEKDVAVRHATSAHRKLEKVARELDAHQAIQQPVASHASAVLTVKPRTNNTQTCASCQHLTLRKTCTEPAAAGLDPPPGLPAGADWFGIRWPPQGYGATCASYSTKPTTLATTPTGAATPLRDNAECSQLQGVIKQ